MFFEYGKGIIYVKILITGTYCSNKRVVPYRLLTGVFRDNDRRDGATLGSNLIDIESLY